MAWSTPSNRSTGDIITAAIWNQDVVANTIALLPSALIWIFDGGGAAYGTDDPIYLRVPFKCDIDRASVLHDQSSTSTFDFWKDTWANAPPTDADTITGGSELATSAAQKNEDTTLSGWTVAVAAGDVIACNVDANDNAQRSTVELKVSRS